MRNLCKEKESSTASNSSSADTLPCRLKKTVKLKVSLIVIIVVIVLLLLYIKNPIFSRSIYIDDHKFNKVIAIDGNYTALNIYESQKTASDLMLLANMYYDAGNYEKLIQCYSAAPSSQDYSLKEKQILEANLGYLYYTGTYFMQDDEKALYHFSQAIEAGELSALPGKLFLLVYTEDRDIDEIISTINLALANNDLYVINWLQTLISNLNNSDSTNLHRLGSSITESELNTLLLTIEEEDHWGSYTYLDYLVGNVDTPYYKRTYIPFSSTKYLYYVESFYKVTYYSEILSSGVMFLPYV